MASARVRGHRSRRWLWRISLALLLATVCAAGSLEQPTLVEEECDCGEALAEEEPDAMGAFVEHLPLSVSLPLIFFLMGCSSLFSGLTLGLMGLDLIGLQIVAKGDNAELARCATKIAPIREKGNQVLCTLLLGNVMVNSALSILTETLMNGVVGFLVSTGLIVFFGEILPQASFSRYALQVGARLVPLVHVLLFIFYPVAKPLSIVLDWILGREVGTIHSRTELMEMLKLQISLGAMNKDEGEFAKQVAEGALSFRDKKVGEIMTPIDDSYMLSMETRLGYEAIREIFETGYSRIPVYGKDKNDYRGLLYTKDLMLADPEDEMKLGDFISIFHRKVETFFQDTKLVNVLNAFKKGGTHIGLVRRVNAEVDTNPCFEIVGVLTLEDVVEEILQAEIVDETDVYIQVDNSRVLLDRERKGPNLGVFNPVWRKGGEKLSREEAAAVAAHLERRVFGHGTRWQLSSRAVEWLVRTSEVHNRTRQTPLDVEEPEEQDRLFRRDAEAKRCVLVLQGQVIARIGKEGFRTEAGPFTILGKEALGREPYTPDFEAHLGTAEVRLLFISKSGFLAAKVLDHDEEKMRKALAALAEGEQGEFSRKAKLARKDSPDEVGTLAVLTNAGDKAQQVPAGSSYQARHPRKEEHSQETQKCAIARIHP